MAKVQIKSEEITSIGGIFHVRELFSRYMGPAIKKPDGLLVKVLSYILLPKYFGVTKITFGVILFSFGVILFSFGVIEITLGVLSITFGV